MRLDNISTSTSSIPINFTKIVCFVNSFKNLIRLCFQTNHSETNRWLYEVRNASQRDYNNYLTLSKIAVHIIRIVEAVLMVLEITANSERTWWSLSYPTRPSKSEVTASWDARKSSFLFFFFLFIQIEWPNTITTVKESPLAYSGFYKVNRKLNINTTEPNFTSHNKSKYTTF